jgi:single-strand DNA-binding protein
MNETMVTLQGYVGGQVKLRQAGEVLVANFRVACTPRRYSRRTQEWFDADTQWYTVNAWRALGEHCSASLNRGDPVVVHGKLSARTFVNANQVEVTTFEVDAMFVGHDLNRGTSSFTKPVRADRLAGSEQASAGGPADVPTAEGDATAAA